MITTFPGIIVRGEVVALNGGAECALPDQTDLWFTERNTRVKPRVTPPDLIVFHDTAGEGDGAQIYRTLIRAQLSVHFSIDRDGLIWQYCDPGQVSCAHAGAGYNSRSIGVEIANAVFPPDPKPGIFASISRYWLTGKERLLGRPVSHESYRGGGRRVLGHFDAQRAAVCALATTLLEHFPSIPARLPRLEPGGKVHGRRVQPDWTGICGHLHVSDAHVDPSVDAFDDLAWKVE